MIEVVASCCDQLAGMGQAEEKLLDEASAALGAPTPAGPELAAPN
ncbi:MAG: hypothetical protein NTW20_13715 [Rhodobacterales bacterium]|nr:hypothetical protein [Rhodobacterales bacterium]